MRLMSPAFAPGMPIPSKHASDGEDLSPALVWDGIPANAQSLVVICDDVDGNGAHHWAVYDLSTTLTGLQEGIFGLAPDDGGKQAVNDFKQPGYTGPKKQGRPRRYRFRLMALRANLLPLRPGCTCAELQAQMRRHVIATAELVGTY